MSDFNQRLRWARKSQGYTQGEMAKKLFISSQGYGKYERGESEPNLVMLKKICIVLDVSADWLLEIPI